IGPAFAPVHVPQFAGVVRALESRNIADLAVVYALERFAHAGVIAPAEPGHERQVLALCLLYGMETGAYAGSVHSDRLFAEYVFAGRDRCLEILRSEAGRRGEDDDVDVFQFEKALVRIPADELVVFADIDLLLA